MVLKFIAAVINATRRGHGFESRSSLDFFQAFFRYCLSSVHYSCDELKNHNIPSNILLKSATKEASK